MEITGRIIAILEARGGVSPRTGSEWKSQEYVIETHEQYPKRCVFTVFGADRIAQFNIQLQQELTVSFDIDAHEWNGRWFNDIRAWKVEPPVTAGEGVAPSDAAAPVGAAPLNTAPAPTVNDMPFTAPAEGVAESTDDLPF